MWSFRLRGPKGKAAALSIAPDASMHSFCDQAKPLLALPKTKPLTLRSGFPPRVATYNATDAVQDVLVRNDTVVIDVADTSSSAAATAPTVIQGTSKTRAAASRSKLTKQKASPPPKPRASGVHTLGGKAATAKRTRATRSARGEGTRLGATLDDDVDAVQGDSASQAERQPKYQRVHALQLSSKDQISEALVAAVANPSSSDRTGKFFRKATKTALEYEHETAIANARLNAALANRFEIHAVTTAGRVGTDSATGNDDNEQKEVAMTVKFKESVRKWRVETVEMLHDVELRAALKYVLLAGGDTGKEMLKPFNMAQCSPRVFWNIARLYNGDVAAGLADLLPDEDWSYLDIRTRVMSKKAVEAKANEAQWKQWKRDQESTTASVTIDSNSSEREADAPIDVIDVDADDDAARGNNSTVTATAARSVAVAAPVTNRNSRGTDPMAIQRALRAAAARAALSRFDIAAHSADVVAAFTTDTTAAATADDDSDDDDVEVTTTVSCDACNKARVLSVEEAAQANVDAPTWTCANLAMTQRADASCDAVDDEVMQLAGKSIALLLQRAGVDTRMALADATPAATLRRLVDPLERTNAALNERLASLIDDARLDVVNDWMSELVGDDELVGLLELQKLGTPADLVTTPLDFVYDAVHGDTRDDVSVERVQLWRDQARAFVLQHPWLEDWRTI